MHPFSCTASVNNQLFALVTKIHRGPSRAFPLCSVTHTPFKAHDVRSQESRTRRRYKPVCSPHCHAIYMEALAHFRAKVGTLLIAHPISVCMFRSLMSSGLVFNFFHINLETCKLFWRNHYSLVIFGRFLSRIRNTRKRATHSEGVRNFAQISAVLGSVGRR